jgi:hypothetical protein
VFERNDYIGGRLKHIVLDGVTVEGTFLFFLSVVRDEVACLSLLCADRAVGGDAWSQVNAYMVELAQELNIQFDNTSYSGNGAHISVQTTQGLECTQWDLLCNNRTRSGGGVGRTEVVRHVVQLDRRGGAAGADGVAASQPVAQLPRARVWQRLSFHRRVYSLRWP